MVILSNTSGLSLARRAGGGTGIVKQIEQSLASFGQERTDHLFMNSFNEKDRSYSWPQKGKMRPRPEAKVRGATNTQGTEKSVSFASANRGLRQVPFDQELFVEICRRFFVHGSISKVINRADVPHFSRFKTTVDIPTAEKGRRQWDSSVQNAISKSCDR